MNNLLKKLPVKERNIIQAIVEMALKTGVNVYLVGGVVRDMILNRDNNDIDIVVDGDGTAFATALAGSLDCRIKTHPAFLTASLILQDKRRVDIATARTESYNAPAALPTVTAGSIQADMYRRDFSINAVALALTGDKTGQLYDPYNGINDIHTETIRIIHLQSFNNDPSRIFRAVRFEQRLGFHFDSQTDSELHKEVAAGGLSQLSGSRVFKELHLSFMEQNPVAVMSRLQQLQILPYIDDSLELDKDVFQNTCNRLINHPPACSRYDACWLALTTHLPDKQAVKLLNWLQAPVKLKKQILSIKKNLNMLS